ncbi:DUF3854 domain-containing protein [Bacillus alkalicellulosilyticus]|uniref:DUF3854 domain-containing protein n=1 Tax=Alkalihalobacterium alkalicellulosilyticum TaxID=1912214 RepID=UPI0014827106|nr:DUF3854 domain-containing protein [Bacillus alkalicellulosilyticus]
MQHEDGNVIACIRTPSERPFSKNSSLPSYLHFLKGEMKRRKIDTSHVTEFEGEIKKGDMELHEVYQTFVDCLSLEDSHYEHLTSSQRKLDDRQILIREYKSFPSKPWETVRDIQEELHMNDFTGIPGFYEANGKYGPYWSVSGAEGILIPFRNMYNQITGFQYRIEKPLNDVKVKQRKQGLTARVKTQPNIVQVHYEGEILWEKEMTLGETTMVSIENDILGWVTLAKGNRYYWLSSANKPKGTGSGNPAPIHISIPTKKLATWETGTALKANTIWLSEGGMKTDIASDCIEKLFNPEEIQIVGDTFVALPGVNAWRLALPLLKDMGVQNINLCFDADVVSNVKVRAILMECVKGLKILGYHVNMVIWNEKDGKGIDDLFLSGKLPQFKRLF